MEQRRLGNRAIPNHGELEPLRERRKRKKHHPPAPGDEPVRAISVRQPFAWAIIHAGKDVENRSPNARRQFQAAVGERVLIHASKGMTADVYEHARILRCCLGCATGARRQGALQKTLAASCRNRAIRANRQPTLTRLRSLFASWANLMRTIGLTRVRLERLIMASAF